MRSRLRIVCLALAAMTVLANKKTTLRVFILAGQSNMEGKGHISHLGQLLFDPATQDTYRHLWNWETDDDWLERDDVYITFNGEKQGKLSVRYGMPSFRFGPELQFGHVVGDIYNKKEGDRVLIIKCAWGGKDLAVDFRPPSSGLGNYTNFEENAPFTPDEYGAYYRKMMEIVKSTMEDIGKVIPDYDPDSVKVKMSGLVWFQGFNDLIDDTKTSEYGSNLANLIRDLRVDLGEPDLPVVIGGLGMAGVDLDPKNKAENLRFRNIQRNVTQMDEFRGNTKYIKTSKCVTKHDETYGGGYHYYGRADTFFCIGGLFGNASKRLIRKWTKRIMQGN